MILKVPSLTTKEVYIVDMFNLTCTCKDFKVRGTKCKHISLVETKNEQGELDFERVTRQELEVGDKVADGRLRYNMSLPETKDVLDRLEKFSRVRLSTHFIMRDFLYCNFDSVAGVANIPTDVDLVLKSGKAICANILEPIIERWGPIFITFGYQCRAGLELADPSMKNKPKASSPHCWDKKTYGNKIYCRVDILPSAVSDGVVGKEEFALWCMDNLDLDLLMCWDKSDVFCLTYSEYKPRRVAVKWVQSGKGEAGSNKITLRGEDYWLSKFPKMTKEQRPKYFPSMSGGKMWHDY